MTEQFDDVKLLKEMLGKMMAEYGEQRDRIATLEEKLEAQGKCEPVPLYVRAELRSNQPRSIKNE